MNTWKEKLADRIDPVLGREIDVFELQMELRRQGQLDEKIFAETRLRRGTYGQRYDNGRRDDGSRVQELKYPCGDLTKGPDTVWDAPGMQRIKIPFGGLTPEQLECMADLADDYAGGVLHVTTRQDIQLHFIHIEDTPSLMRRLAAVDITTREACGNAVRNVTACPLSGVCRDEAFDVTPYAKTCARFLLGHPDTQDFGRKFKIAFSGCRDHACALTNMHDLGAIAVTRQENGKTLRGFELYVGGGLGAVPHQAKLFDAFLPEEELLPTAQAISRVFARLGEKKNRARARIKFLVAKLGIDEFKRQVQEERAALKEDPRWTEFLAEAWNFQEKPLKDPASLNGEGQSESFRKWASTNVYPQRQTGYAVVTVSLPLGDMSSWQARRLADLARSYSGDNIRLTVEQNLVLRWVPERDLPQLFAELEQIGLSEAGAGTLIDITACPGTDTCKLGISSSRGVAAEIRRRLASRYWQLDEAARNLKIKISGCFNSCGQHHLADLGFYGNSRTIGNRKVPHFQVVVGGQWRENAGAYGLAIGAVPAKRIPEAVDRITGRYIEERAPGETFQDWVRRIGKKELRATIEDLMEVPAYEVDSSFYSDWGDPREFTLGDLGVGECAGEVVAIGQFELAAAERMVFEAQLKMDENDFARADELAYRAMLEAVKGLLKSESFTISVEPEELVREFRRRFYETRRFYDPYAGGKFAEYLFARHQAAVSNPDRESAHRLIEEAQLFIEAAHSCRDRIARRENLQTV